MSLPEFQPEDVRGLFANLDQIHLVFIHATNQLERVRGRDFGTDVEAAIDASAVANRDGWNIYWTVNQVRPGLNTKPSKADITAARFAHVDIDPPKSGGAFDKPRIVEALGNLGNGRGVAPSFVIDSGGGLQAFWRLDGACENLPAIEAINRQVQDYCDADACWNIDRLMRVPGTVNHPDKRKLARGRVPALATWAIPDDGVCHEPHVLAASFPPEKPKASSAASSVELALPANVEPITADSLGLSEFDPLRLAIEQPPGRDRSGDGVACARLMANAGYTDAEIMGVLLNPENPVSAHYLNQRDPRRAAARTLQLVRADGPASGEPLQAQPADTAWMHEMVANMVRKTMTPTALAQEPENGAAQPQEPEWTVPAGQPGWMRDIGDSGLGWFVQHVCDTAPSPQPWVTLGAALAMFGAVAGRRYASPTNLRTNLYSIGIADSGGGKDHPLRAITRMMVAAGLAGHVGGSKIASGSGLVTAVTRSPSILFPLDEVGFLISSAADRRRSPKHVTEIMDNLTEFYSLADSTFLGTAYANDKEKPREVIEQPCLCLFGVTTPGVFWSSLSSGNVLDGSLARMIIFESEDDYPDPQHDIRSHAFPDEMVELTKRISKGCAAQNPFPMGEGPAIVPKPYPLPYADTTAAATARAMREEQTAMLRQHKGTNLTSIIARLAENAAKIALIRAIVANPERPVMTRHDLEWGMSVARRSVDTLMSAVKERVADNEQEAKLKRLQKTISDAGSAGIDHMSLLRQSRYFGSRRHLNDALDFLVEAGAIRALDMPRADGKPGKGRRVYFDTE